MQPVLTWQGHHKAQKPHGSKGARADSSRFMHALAASPLRLPEKHPNSVAWRRRGLCVVAAINGRWPHAKTRGTGRQAGMWACGGDASVKQTAGASESTR